jgi:hypothetical protein
MRLFAVLVLGYLIGFVEGRGIWGGRKKKSDDEPSAPVVESGLFTGSNKNNANARKLQQPQPSKMAMDGFSSSSVSALIEKIYGVFDTVEQMMDTPEFSDMMTPDTIREAFLNVPGIEQHQEVLAMLDSPQFTDPVMLRQTILDGIQEMRIYVDQMGTVMKDPTMRSSMLAALPPDLALAVERLIEGDMSGVRTFLEGTPGIEEEQINIILSLLEGDITKIQDQMLSLLANKDHIEATRQQLLQNPQMAEMMGIEMEVIRNKRKWNEMVKEMKNQLNGSGPLHDLIRESAASM